MFFLPNVGLTIKFVMWLDGLPEVLKGDRHTRRSVDWWRKAHTRSAQPALVSELGEKAWRQVVQVLQEGDGEAMPKEANCDGDDGGRGLARTTLGRPGGRGEGARGGTTRRGDKGRKAVREEEAAAEARADAAAPRGLLGGEVRGSIQTV
ncbi:hypothetical protein ACP4OV_005337 [Aristida adscensionis]